MGLLCLFIIKDHGRSSFSLAIAPLWIRLIASRSGESPRRDAFLYRGEEDPWEVGNARRGSVLFSIEPAVGEMVIDHADGLAVSIDDGRAHKRHAALFQIL